MKRKWNLTNRRYREYHNFFLRGEIWETIKKAHGWKDRGSVTKFADALGITRQYADLIVKQKSGCSADVMFRIICFMGFRKGDCWCHIFDVVPDDWDDGVSPDHPIYSMLKHNGAIPYSRYSTAAMQRKQDYNVEERKK